VKIKNIKPQSTLNKEKRVENVINAYKVVKYEDLSGKKILLIDDVYTTGSTVNECARVLLNLNCEEIGVLSLAKD
jgi:predicted amidophosphoribosyltransferase